MRQYTARGPWPGTFAILCNRSRCTILKLGPEIWLGYRIWVLHIPNECNECTRELCGFSSQLKWKGDWRKSRSPISDYYHFRWLVKPIKMAINQINSCMVRSISNKICVFEWCWGIDHGSHGFKEEGEYLHNHRMSIHAFILVKVP